MLGHKLLDNLNPINKIKVKGRRKKKGRRNELLAWKSKIAAPAIKLDLSLKCRKLPNKDSFSKANGFCAVWEVPPGYLLPGVNLTALPARQEKEVGRTEVLREDSNPNFQTVFQLEYRFNIEQPYIVRVYDEDLRYASDLKEHDFVGGGVFTLGELLGAYGCSIARPLDHGGTAYLILTGTEVLETREVFEFRFAGQGLGLLERKNKLQDIKKKVQKVQVGNIGLKQVEEKLTEALKTLDHFDPYFELERLHTEDQSWKQVFKSEVLKEQQNPCWNVARLPLQLLCGDDPTTPLKISFYDYNRVTAHELAGSIETSIDELVHKAKRGIPVFDVMFEKRKIIGGTKLKKAGTLKVLKGSIIEMPSMMQYVSGGCKMDLIFAVDCTQANLMPGGGGTTKNLHHHISTYLNDYQAAILKFSSIYDSFKSANGLTLWGYGGVWKGVHRPYLEMGEHLENSDAVLQTYDVWFSSNNMNAASKGGNNKNKNRNDNDKPPATASTMTATPREIAGSFQLGQRAEMHHVIEKAMYRAIRSNKEHHCYTTLVLLTTGAIHDPQSTVDAVCAAAEDAPLSIVVVGVGEGPFKTLEGLLTDESSGSLRHSNGVPVALDTVQFVSFDDYNGSANRCAAAALRDVPEQFVQHFLNAGILPQPPQAKPDFAKLAQQARRTQKRLQKKQKKQQQQAAAQAAAEQQQSDDDESEYND